MVLDQPSEIQLREAQAAAVVAQMPARLLPEELLEAVAAARETVATLRLAAQVAVAQAAVVLQ